MQPVSDNSKVTLKKLRLLYSHTGEELEGLLFPGFIEESGDTLTPPRDILVGSSPYAAHYDHKHLVDDLDETESSTNVLVPKDERDKLEKLPTYDKLLDLIRHEIGIVNWIGQKETYEQLLTIDNPSDGDTYAVLRDSEYDGKPYPAGTYRYHAKHGEEDEVPSGFYLVSLSSTPLATENYSGTISSEWFSKLNGILGTGIKGIVTVVENGDTGTSDYAARADHIHSGYLQNETGLSDTTASQKIGTNLKVPSSFFIQTDDDDDKVLVCNNSSGYCRFGSGNRALRLTSRAKEGENIAYVRGSEQGFIWDSFNLPKEKIDNILNGGAFPGYGGEGDVWGTAKTVARSDHKHNNYFQIEDTGGGTETVVFPYFMLGGATENLYFTIKNGENRDTVLAFGKSRIAFSDCQRQLIFNSEDYLYRNSNNDRKSYKIWDEKNLTTAVVDSLKDIADNGVSKIINAFKISLNGGGSEGSDLFTYDGSAEKNINITPGSIGAAASGHTHNYAGSDSAGGSANSTKGTLTFTIGSSTDSFNGSTNKSMSITASAIGAAAASHTHSYLPLTGGTLSGDLSMGGKQITNCANILFSSDERLKHNIRRFVSKQDEEKTKTIFGISAYDFRFKNDIEQRLHCGYIAQKVNEVAPEFIGVNEKGVLSVDYISIHTKKIAILEDMIRELRDEIVMLKKNLK